MEQPPGHLLPKNTVIATYVGLLILTGLMVGISRIDTSAIHIDWLNLHFIKAWVVMGIAAVMGLVTAMFLMGLWYEHKLLNITIFVSLLIFVVFTWADTSFRGELDPSYDKKIDFVSPVKTEPAGHEGAGHEAAPAHEAPAH